MTGLVTVIPSDRGSFGTGLAINSSDTIYLAPSNTELYTIDPVTGDVTLATGLDFVITTIGNVSSLTFDANDVLWGNAIQSAGGSTGNLGQIDLGTGDFEVFCSELPVFTDSLVYYGESTDLIFRNGFE